MKKFIKKMLSTGDNVSSKRVSGFLSLIVAILLSMVITAGILFFQINLTAIMVDILKYIYGGLLCFSAASFGLTSFEKFSNKKEEVKNDNVNL